MAIYYTSDAMYNRFNNINLVIVADTALRWLILSCCSVASCADLASCADVSCSFFTLCAWDVLQNHKQNPRRAHMYDKVWPCSSKENS